MKPAFLYTVLLCCLLFAGLSSFAQTATLSGSVQDTLNYKPMAFTNVSLVRLKDSVLVKQLWTKDNGGFRFSSIKPDTYIVQVTRPTFADYEEVITLAPGENKELGNIAMISKTNLLQEVLIKERGNAIRIKGDTVEFLADSFIGNKNSNVEDLLKRLPGIQVDKEGKITAHGQEVKKVLVDGEEFFGDDPTVATKNLRAENIDKVQVFEKKSEQAAFTGIDDGEKVKTINLQLKEDARKGYFGKASAGIGTEKRYEHDAMANFFKNKRKISAYGAMSNTNKTRMSWGDANRYGSANNNYEYDEASGAMYSFYRNDNMDFDGVGIPETWYTGIHYSDKLKDDAHGFNLNATRKEMSSSGYNNNYSKYILPDTLYYVNNYTNVTSRKSQNSGTLNYEWKVDSFSTMKLKFSGSQGRFFTESSTRAENRNGNNVLVNDNARVNTNTSYVDAASTSLSWNKKFRREGRTLILQFNHTYKNEEGDGLLRSQVNFYRADGSVLSGSNIDQKKTTSSKSNFYSGKLNYTEPLSKTWFVLADYSLAATVSQSDRISYALANNEYSLRVDSLSNDLRYDILSHRGGLALRYIKKKVNVSVGGKISYTDMRQEDVFTSRKFNQYFVNVFPSAGFNYKIKNTTNLSINYNGNTRQPNVQQIQPIQDNTNPLDIYIGNPNLRQSFENAVTFSYNAYQPLSGRNFYSHIRYSYTNDDFASFDRVDEQGRRTHQTVNVDGVQNIYSYIGYGYGIKKYKLRFGTSSNPSYSRNVNYVNGLYNINKNLNANINQSISYNLDKKIYAEINAGYGYTHSVSSLRPDVPTRYLIQTYSAETEIYLPFKFTLNGDDRFNVRQKTSDFDRNLNTVIASAGIKKKLLKSEALTIALEGNDLLNQQLGFDRTAESNYINEHVYSVLKRYFMFRITWDFTKGPVEKED